MVPQNGKRTASSPLSSEFQKKLRVGLKNEERKNMNDSLCLLLNRLDHATQIVQLPADVSTSTLALTFEYIVTRLLDTSCASSVDASWTRLKDCEKRIGLLSLEERLRLASLWIEARDKGDWERFINYALFQVEPPRDPQEAAIEKSWERPFQGNAAICLGMYIEMHTERKYARFFTLVQSSGMGKSRTVDELAKYCFVIPLNLRPATSTGYPPADDSVREYLTSPGSKDYVYDRVCAFLEMLFDHTTSILLEFDGQQLDYVEYSRRFRRLMTEGQTMQGHNQFRDNFYKRVVEMAKHRLSGPILGSDFPPYPAFKKLGQALGLFSAPSTDKNHFGLVVLAFDDAQTLTVPQRQPSVRKAWSVFDEIREALRRLQNLPLFSLFLSTQVFQPIVEERQDCRSMVIVPRLVPVQSFPDLGFDPLARAINASGSWNLERLTEDAQMFSMGRPLFAARYLDGSDLVKEEIIRFAATKLLNDEYYHIEKNLSKQQTLACLSQRLPLEFKPSNYICQEQEREQMNAHMRNCIGIEASSEIIKTISSSEPILSEAAYFVMQRSSFNAPKALKLVMESFFLSKGDRGEFLVLLLLTLARDSAVGPADAFGRPISGRRWFGLADFLYGRLFRRQQQQTATAPSLMTLVDDESLRALCMLEKDFPNAQLHFSHFVKVHEISAIDLKSVLLLQLGRGAGVLCANKMTEIEAILVFLKEGTKVELENAGLILCQISNDTKYAKRTEPEQIRFDEMDPYDLWILGQPEEDEDEEGFDNAQAAARARAPAVPLIKIVFVLAAKKPALRVVRRAPTEDYPAVVYEIWCAGISPDFLEPVEAREVDTWDSLLEASYGWKEVYETGSEIIAGLRKSMTPGVAGRDAHYSSWVRRP